MVYPSPTPVPVPVDEWAAIRDAPDPKALPLQTDGNIQGNVLAGFSKDHQMLLFVGWDDAGNGRAWLNDILPRISTNAQVFAFNARFSAARRSSGSDPENAFALWTNVSFTADGIESLAPAAVAELRTHNPLEPGIQAWLDGAASDAAVAAVGDAGLSGPANWLFGAAGPKVMAIVCVAADRPADLAVELANQRRLIAQHHLSLLFEQPGETQPGAAAGHEHFGFKDGISQPGVWGLDPESQDPNRAGEVDGRHGTDLIAAGTFVLGYPRDPETEGGGPLAGVASPLWMFDGSFLTTRRLAQDVPAFWAAIEAQYSGLGDAAKNDPNTGIHSADALAAKLVGRWRSGTPTDRAPLFDNRSAQNPADDNDFDFQADQPGLKTPACSHIRKVYPRKGAIGLDEDGTKAHRILRRGIPFGEPFAPGDGRGHGVDASRGLVFQCYQASLADQFIFLQKIWVNADDFPSAGTGKDPVIGTGSQITIPGAAGNSTPTFASFVTTEGSVFALTPSIPTLQLLAAGADLRVK